MKKKDIAKYLDKVGTALALAETRIVPKRGADMSKVPTEAEMEALKLGMALGLALGALVCEGRHEPKSPQAAVVDLIAAGLEIMEEDREEAGE